MVSVPKELDKQPFIAFIVTLEKLMGESKFVIWLSEKYPEVNTIEAQKKRAIENEAALKKEVIIKICDLIAIQTYRNYEKEKAALLDLLQRHKILMDEFVNQLNQYENDHENFLKRLAQQDRIAKDQLALIFEKIAELLKHINIRIQYLVELIGRINTLLTIVNRKMNKEISKLLNMYEKIILNIPESNPEIKKIKINLLHELPDLYSAINNKNKIDLFENHFNTAINEISKIDSGINFNRALLHIDECKQSISELQSNRSALITKKNSCEAEMNSLNLKIASLQSRADIINNDDYPAIINNDNNEAIDIRTNSDNDLASIQEALNHDEPDHIDEDELDFLEDLEIKNTENELIANVEENRPGLGN